MKSLACMSVGSLLAKRESGLTGAERLRIEEHLQRCDSCRSDARALHAITALSQSPAIPSLTSRARERAIAGALMHATRQPTPELMPTRSRGPLLAWAGAGLVAAAAAATVLVVTNGDSEKTARSTTAQDDAAVLLAGDVNAGGNEIEVGGRIEPGTLMATNEGAQLTMGRASIELEPASEIAWQPTEETVRLGAGSLRAKVQPDPSRRFRVVTDTFAVEVLGTEFEVSTDSVEVFEGTVRIVGNDGNVLAAALTKGGSWQAGIAAKAPAKKKKRAHRRPRKRNKSVAEATAAVDVAALLASARSHLAAKSVAAAREDIQRALDAEPSRREQAEAYSLIAECALVSGEPAKASRLYLQVTDNYRGLSAAENALFAAARIEANAGNAAAAKKHLERYLERYPDGRFRSEAERRLSEIE